MRIVVSTNGKDLDSEASPVFGRCPIYMFVDTETFEFEAVDNPAMSAAGGAGIQAAQFIVSQGAQAVVSGHMGPNAYQVLAAAGVPIYLAHIPGWEWADPVGWGEAWAGVEVGCDDSLQRPRINQLNETRRSPTCARPLQTCAHSWQTYWTGSIVWTRGNSTCE